MKKRKKLLLWSAVVVALECMFLVKADDAALTIRNQLAAIAAAGDPVAPADADKWYSTPPADQNAAPLYEQAFAAMKNEDPQSEKFVFDNIQALPLLIKAADRHACRYPMVLADGFATKLPHLTKIKRAATFLKMVAINQTAQNRTDAATATLQAGFSLARSLDDEPLVISKLVDYASLSLILQGMDQSFSRQAFSDAQLQALESTLKNAEMRFSLHRPLAYERACGISVFQMSGAELAKAGGNMTNVDLVAYSKTAKFQQDFAFLLDYYSELIALTEIPYGQAMKALPKLADRAEKAKTQGFVVSSMLISASGTSSFQKAAKAAAFLRDAQTAVAIERYRLKHANDLPGTLADLVPTHLSAVPEDPFDGQPLRFKPLPGKGYVVYSVGANLVDDGGVEKSPDGKNQLDIPFTVQR
jgi:hypothetical protein